MLLTLLRAASTFSESSFGFLDYEILCKNKRRKNWQTHIYVTKVLQSEIGRSKHDSGSGLGASGLQAYIRWMLSMGGVWIPTIISVLGRISSRNWDGDWKNWISKGKNTEQKEQTDIILVFWALVIIYSLYSIGHQHNAVLRCHLRPILCF